MGGANGIRFVEIGDGPGYLQDSRIAPGAQTQLVDGHLQQATAVLVDDAVPPDLLVGHARIAERILPRKAILLSAPGGVDASLDDAGRFAAVFSPDVPASYRRNVDGYIDPVQQGPGDSPLILADLQRRAPARLARIAIMAAGAYMRRPLPTFCFFLAYRVFIINQEDAPQIQKV